MSLSPAARIATTVAKAMAERGDDVGPNVTLVLLAEMEASQARIARLAAVVQKSSAALHRPAKGWRYQGGSWQAVADALDALEPGDLDAPTGAQEER